MKVMTMCLSGGLILLGSIGMAALASWPKTTQAQNPPEMRCDRMRWYIDGKLHAGPRQNLNVDVPLRCQDGVALCYVYHGYLSCVRK